MLMIVLLIVMENPYSQLFLRYCIFTITTCFCCYSNYYTTGFIESTISFNINFGAVVIIISTSPSPWQWAPDDSICSFTAARVSNAGTITPLSYLYLTYYALHSLLIIYI
eukprot:51675_1